ncbi:MAG: glycosyltransferase [Deltaproteobacteria bacterium]|nr:glycosyltransferase [Deltaproteobacteria bacterium]
MDGAIKVSVVLPTYCGERYIRQSIESILQNRYEEFELIVVDQSPTRAIEQLIQEFFPSDPRLKYVHIEKCGASHARNVGTQLSSGELMLFGDDDVVVTPEWINAYVNCYTQLLSSGIKPGAMGGPVEGLWEAEKPPWWPEEYGYLICEFDMGNQRKEYEQGWLPFSANIAFPKDILQEVGGFHEGMGPKADSKLSVRVTGEDTLCVMKVRQKGYPLYYEPNAKVFHIMIKERLSKKYYLKRIFEEGCTQVNVRFLLYPVTRRVMVTMAYDSLSRLVKCGKRFITGRFFSNSWNEKTQMLELGLMGIAMGELYWTWKCFVSRKISNLSTNTDI